MEYNGPEKMRRVAAQNRADAKDEGCTVEDLPHCASHNYCDANMFMQAALADCGIVDTSDSESPEGDEYGDTWDRVWRIAKGADFIADNVR